MQGTDIDRIAIRLPFHLQIEREVDFSKALKIPENSIDIVIAEVKNTTLKFNDTLIKSENRALENWEQLLRWVGLFSESEVTELVPKLIAVASHHGKPDKDIFEIIPHTNAFGLITIRLILFSIENTKKQNGNKLWINGKQILDYIWHCFAPEFERLRCSPSYDFKLWGFEYMDIVIYIKNRYKKGLGAGTLNDMYEALIK